MPAEWHAEWLISDLGRMSCSPSDSRRCAQRHAEASGFLADDIIADREARCRMIRIKEDAILQVPNERGQRAHLDRRPGVTGPRSPYHLA